MVLFVLAGCGHLSTLDPPRYEYPCAKDDEPVDVADSDATLTGFSADQAVELIDGFMLDVTYDLDRSVDTSVPTEQVALSATRTSEAVQFVDRAVSPPDVMGNFPGGQCLTGPMLRIPLTIRWPMHLADGSVGWWEADRVFEVGSVEDPALIDVFVDIDYHSLDEMPPELADYARQFTDGKDVDYASLTAWGTLASGDSPPSDAQGFSIDIEPDHSDDTGGVIVGAGGVEREGSWVAVEQ